MEAKYKDIKDEELVDFFKYKYEYHSAEAKKFKLFLDLYDSTYNTPDTSSNGHQEAVIDISDSIPVVKRRGKKTFEDHVVDILNGGKPMTAKMLFNQYNKLGLKKITLKDFSSKLSIRSKSGTKIKNAKFPDYAINQRYWWALGDWFDGDSLKDEYTAKVHNFMSLS